MGAGVAVFIGLGSNLDDPHRQVQQGLEQLGRLPGYSPVASSSLYRTAPVGKTDQPTFYNAVASGSYNAGPRDLLAGLQEIEKKAGRVRQEKWGPRTLDLDLLVFGDRIIDEPGLQVPHPEMANRAFVLVPLAEVAPHLKVPRWQMTAAQLLARLSPSLLAGQKVVKV